MSIDLSDINVQEASSFLKDSTNQNHFSKAKHHEVEFTYSGGATAGNYKTTCHISQMGKTQPGGKFTGTVVMTLHDIGLNHFTNYATLFQNSGMQPILDKFTCFHVDLPCMRPNVVKSSHINSDNYIIQTNDLNASQNSGSNKQWDRNLIYPSLEELANSMMPAILEYFGLHSIILFGTGVGANIATRFTLSRPENIVGLISINPIHYAVGWSEWFWDKTASLSNDKIREYILAYLFSANELSDPSYDLVRGTEQSIKQMDIDALTGLYNSFKTRTPIDIEKPVAPSDLRTKSNVIKVPTCIIIGDWASGFMEDAMELNSLIDPKISNFCKLADSGAMVYEEQPAKVAESIKLFLQGLGYLSTILATRNQEQNAIRAEKLSKASIEANSGGFGDIDTQMTRFSHGNCTSTVNDLI